MALNQMLVASLATLTLAGAFVPAIATAEQWLVYIGTYTGEKSRGIYVARFDDRTGTLSEPELAAEMVSPSFLAAHPKEKVLYAVSENWDSKQPVGSVHAFAIQRPGGKLVEMGQRASGGKGPCHVAVDVKGRCVLVANYGSGSVAAFPLSKSGELLEAASTIQHRGSSVHPQRQKGPHAHQIVPDPQNQRALVCDLGLDKVLVYDLDIKKARLNPNVPFGVSVPAGSGPRHLAFHPGGKHVFVLNELSCTVDLFSYGKGGTLHPVQSVKTLPEGFTGENTCAEIQVHPSGKFLYASNRGHDSLAIFRIEASSGRLSLVGHQNSGGRIPRYFGFDPKGEWLVAANQESDNLVTFEVNPTTGELRRAGQERTVGKPVCLLFLPQ